MYNCSYCKASKNLFSIITNIVLVVVDINAYLWIFYDLDYYLVTWHFALRHYCYTHLQLDQQKFLVGSRFLKGTLKTSFVN